MSFMSQPTSKDIEKDKLERFNRVLAAIKALERQQKQVLKQGQLAPEPTFRMSKCTQNFALRRLLYQNLYFSQMAQIFC